MSRSPLLAAISKTSHFHYLQVPRVLAHECYPYTRIFLKLEMTMREKLVFKGPKLSIMIAGGGIGGLIFGLQLHAIGITEVDIFESVKHMAILGVGINLQPSAVLILKNLGLLDSLAATGIETAEKVFYNKHGNLILSEKCGKAAGYTIPQYSIHRGKLHELLLKAFKERLGEDRFHLDHRVVSYSPATSTAKITAHFVSHSKSSLPSRSADILIAADGINSAIRAQAYPTEGPPRFSGFMLWRGTIPCEPYLTGRSMVWAGYGDKKFIAYPISQEHLLEGKCLSNWIAEIRVQAVDDPNIIPPKPDYSKTVPKERFASEFEGWNFEFLDVPDMIQKAKDIYEFPMCDRDPVPRWTFGRMTLLGDAAHPMYPFGSNGASQAIIDAEELALQLCKHPTDVDMALKEYENIRMPATEKIVYANRGQGPDHIMQIVEERSPDGFLDVHDAISDEEMRAISDVYKAVAGFDIQLVNLKAEESAEFL
jgi:2-polyprenyl-6-methoxyphenol hydroxylase-like FAD-dependent oxidoreductase